MKNTDIAAAATAAALGTAGGAAGAAPVTAGQLPDTAQVAQQTADLAKELIAQGLDTTNQTTAEIAAAAGGRQNYLDSTGVSYAAPGTLSGRITSVSAVPCNPQDIDCIPNPVPEPSTLPLAGLALVGAAAAGLRKVSQGPKKEK